MTSFFVCLAFTCLRVPSHSHTRLAGRNNKHRALTHIFISRHLHLLGCHISSSTNRPKKTTARANTSATATPSLLAFTLTCVTQQQRRLCLLCESISDSCQRTKLPMQERGADPYARYCLRLSLSLFFLVKPRRSVTRTNKKQGP